MYAISHAHHCTCDPKALEDRMCNENLVQAIDEREEFAPRDPMFLKPRSVGADKRTEEGAAKRLGSFCCTVSVVSGWFGLLADIRGNTQGRNGV
jgi:hypothetical protein